ncbi:hypothetical protein BT96DRAFT_1092979 [Gymnopus androsaceus JB14]|uniref:Uncharacterized protein n=1 Tax=Gymnopus androsaceus JB14 TaxID=1447944 RepID=A0A6A4HSG1_9AGAR|nr:hypothetical protein BT96DRAFT_1092979 [Gymnopus androsaceus JB14]
MSFLGTEERKNRPPMQNSIGNSKSQGREFKEHPPGASDDDDPRTPRAPSIAIQSSDDPEWTTTLDVLLAQKRSHRSQAPRAPSVPVPSSDDPEENITLDVRLAQLRANRYAVLSPPDEEDDWFDEPTVLIASQSSDLVEPSSDEIPLLKSLSYQNLTQRAKKNREKAARQRASRAHQSALQTSDAAKTVIVDSTLRKFMHHGIRIIDLMKRIFDPASRQGNIRWDFCRRAGNATRILNFWVSPRNAPSAQAEVTDWAVEHTATLVAEEARKITESGLLRSSASTRPITVFARIKSGAATTTTRIYRAFTEAPRCLATQGEARARRTATVIASNIFTSLGEYSNAITSTVAHGSYLYANQYFGSNPVLAGLGYPRVTQTLFLQIPVPKRSAKG